MYCGDETGAFVGDVSSYSSCFGYGGEDCPKSVLPSYMYEDGTIPTSLHHFRSRRSTATATATGAASTKSTASSTSSPTSSSSPSPSPSPSIPTSSQYSFQSEDDIVPIYSPYPSLNVSNNSNISSNGNANNPLHPDCYLENDTGLIQNYNAYENVWMKAFNDLNVRHLGKHYHGYGSGHSNNRDNRNNNMNKVVKTKRIYQVSSSNINDAKSKSQDDSLDNNQNITNNYQSLIHPLLAIDSGYTHTTTSCDNGGGGGGGSSSENIIKRNQRAKITEILFESLSAPAAFIAPSPMVSSFAFGRQTSLIVDIGARGMRVTPIVDGLLLENAQRRSGRGGEWLNSVQNFVVGEYCNDPIRSRNRKRRRDGNRNGCENGNGSVCDKESLLWSVHPRYACRPNKEKENGIMNIHYPCTNIQQSIFHNLAVRDVMYEMKTSPHVTGVSLYRDDDWTVPFLDMNIIPKKNDKHDVNASTSASNGDKTHDGKENKIESSEAMDIDDKEGENDLDRNDDNDTDVDTDDVNEDYEAKSKKRYTLPDGTKISLQKTQSGKDLCRLAELFFAQDLPFSSTFAESSTEQQEKRPGTFSSLPIHELIKSSLSAVADADVRKELCGNIILTGASSLFPNMEQRLSLEISYLVPNMYRCKVIASRNTLERRYSPWIGGSVLTSLGSFQQLWLSKTEYEEYGAMLASQRFP